MMRRLGLGGKRQKFTPVSPSKLISHYSNQYHIVQINIKEIKRTLKKNASIYMFLFG